MQTAGGKSRVLLLSVFKSKTYLKLRTTEFLFVSITHYKIRSRRTQILTRKINRTTATQVHPIQRARFINRDKNP